MLNLRAMRTLGLLAPVGAGLLYGGLRLSARPAQSPADKAIIGKQADGTYFVPTGQTLAPAGRSLTFEGRPVDMALRPDGKMLAVMLAREVRLLDTATGQFQPTPLRGAHNFGGIAWAKDGRTLYTTGHASVDEDGPQTGVVYVTRFNDAGQATQQPPIAFALKSRITPNTAANNAEPCGLALAPDDKTLYVTLFNNGTLAAVDLSTYNPDTGAAKCVETPVGSSPERVVVSADGAKIYVANRGGKAPEAGDTKDTQDPVVVDPDTYKASTGTLSVVSAAQITTDAAHAVTRTIDVGLQPADLRLSPDGKPCLRPTPMPRP